MMSFFKKRFFKVTPLLLSVVVFSGCSSSPKMQTPADILEPQAELLGYKRSLQIISEDQNLKDSFRELISSFTPEIILLSEDSFTEFRLILSKKVERVKSLETKPRLLGYLQKDKTPVHYKILYTLQKTSGHTLAEGEIEEFTETDLSVYPRLSYKTEISTEQRDRIASKVIQEIRQNISSTAWSAEIIGQKDPFHVTMSGDKRLGLNIGDRFVTKTQPTSTLELVLFETTANSGERPVLRLVSGPLPTTGKSLAPIDSEKPVK